MKEAARPIQNEASNYLTAALFVDVARAPECQSAIQSYLFSSQYHELIHLVVGPHTILLVLMYFLS